ncbi:MAG: histidine triad nucleotide-binding protein [Deltaproteobacteria bacterium]|nr:histidine triad nucleotide-binding protein [Deltaproteobacteria bacterium]
MTIFKKIIEKEIPADIVYEDDVCVAFKDINPIAPTHILIIPKKEIPTLADVDENDKELIGHILWVATRVAKEHGLSGYRIVVNVGKEGGQHIFHLHFHLIGGRSLNWPPG